MHLSKLKIISEPQPFMITDNAINYTIPELVSYLQSTFLPEDFESVEQILLAKEDKMKKEASMEMGKVKKELDSVRKNHGEMALSKLTTEDELKAYKRECEELREQVQRLEREKRSAEARFEELGSRVSRLEEDTKVLTSEQPLVWNRVGEEFTAANAGLSEVMDRNGDTKGPHCSQIARSTETKEEVDLPNSEIKFGRPVTKIIEIIDSDDEPMGDNSLASALKRKRASPFGGGGDDGSSGCGSQSVRQKMKQPQEFILKKKDLHGDRCSTVPTSSSGKSVGPSDKPTRQNSGFLRACEEKFRSEPKSPRYTSDIFLSKINSCGGEDSSSDSSESEDDVNADDWLLSQIERNRKKFFEEKPVKGL